ncbi:MAG: STAS domain-containing protein [Planctomycetota bacterium]
MKREELDTTVVLTVAGSVDITSSPELRGELKAALDRRAPRIIVDMQGVTFVDSSGLATLIEALQKVKDYEGRLLLCRLSDTVLGVFQLANLDRIFHIKKTREAALEA